MQWNPITPKIGKVLLLIVKPILSSISWVIGILAEIGEGCMELLIQWLVRCRQKSRDRKYNWHKHWAWRPYKLGNGRVAWLEHVERRLETRWYDFRTRYRLHWVYREYQPNRDDQPKGFEIA